MVDLRVEMLFEKERIKKDRVKLVSEEGVGVSYGVVLIFLVGIVVLVVVVYYFSFLIVGEFCILVEKIEN